MPTGKKRCFTSKRPCSLPSINVYMDWSPCSGPLVTFFFLNEAKVSHAFASFFQKTVESSESMCVQTFHFLKKNFAKTSGFLNCYIQKKRSD